MNQNSTYNLAFKKKTVSFLWIIGFCALAYMASIIGVGTVLWIIMHGGFIPILIYMYATTGRWLNWELPWEYHSRILQENGVYRPTHYYDHEADVYNSGRQPRPTYYRD